MSGLVATSAPFLTIHGLPVFFAEDWQSGRIGGGLWTTGLALARYFGSKACVENLERLCAERGAISVLELGSGNGFLAVCLAAVAAAHPTRVKIQNLVVTDRADHLKQIEETILLNKESTQFIEALSVREHAWGSFAEDDSDEGKIDLIIGSDVAYREHLYDPLIKSLKYYSHSKTVSLIGVTMADTTAAFFDRLHEEGFLYRRFADHLLSPEYRGTTFGIFAIRLRSGG